MLHRKRAGKYSIFLPWDQEELSSWIVGPDTAVLQSNMCSLLDIEDIVQDGLGGIVHGVSRNAVFILTYHL